MPSAIQLNILAVIIADEQYAQAVFTDGEALLADWKAGNYAQAATDFGKVVADVEPIIGSLAPLFPPTPAPAPTPTPAPTPVPNPSPAVVVSLADHPDVKATAVKFNINPANLAALLQFLETLLPLILHGAAPATA